MEQTIPTWFTAELLIGSIFGIIGSIIGLIMWIKQPHYGVVGDPYSGLKPGDPMIYRPSCFSSCLFPIMFLLGLITSVIVFVAIVF